MAVSYNSTDLQILKALWGAERMSAREVHDALHKETGWSYSTTRTLLADSERARSRDRLVILLAFMPGARSSSS